MGCLNHNPGKHKILVLDGVFSVYRFDRKAKIDVPSLVPGGFFSITFTDEEISIVTKEDFGAKGSKVEKNWKCLKIEGPLDFDQIGVIHGILEIFMKAGVSVFVISTYNTDYFLVRENMLLNATEALKKNGFEI